MSNFDIPIVLFIFRRKDTTLRILEKIAAVKPKRLYLISDGPRNEVEAKQVSECRICIEKAISWDCDVVKNYTNVNRGVLDRIGLGAKWVFEREECAIFLEDDNLPEVTFFEYCREMLLRWKDDTRVLWICGTNYLGKYFPENGASYMFTKHLLPCGWASWANKYRAFYDEKLSLLDDHYLRKRLPYEYSNHLLYKQQLYSFYRTKYLVETDPRSSSWDYQMAFAVRMNNLYGISPCVNQIENIGVDAVSEHGGHSRRNVMVRRFTNMKSYPMCFPMIHPNSVLSDMVYEKKIESVILFPWYLRFLFAGSRILKRILGIPKYEGIAAGLKKQRLTGIMRRP